MVDPVISGLILGFISRVITVQSMSTNRKVTFRYDEVLRYELGVNKNRKFVELISYKFVPNIEPIDESCFELWTHD